VAYESNVFCNSNKKLLITILFMSVTLSSCIAIPIPTPLKIIDGQPVTNDQLSFLTPGHTTRDIVIDRLGPPSVVWEDACILAYNWEVRQGIVVWVAGAGYTGAAGVGDITERYIFLLQFDDNDRLIRSGKVVHEPFESYGDNLEKWFSESEKKCNYDK
jgi:hypothetical protein